VRLRLVVVAVFVLAAALTGFIAYTSGVLPAPTAASADAVTEATGPESLVTTLAWPKEALGLGATNDLVVWEQRDRSKAVAGLWAYDVTLQQQYRLLGPVSVGAGAGHPGASGDTVVWAAWAGRRGAGVPRIEAYNEMTMRRWTVAEHGRDPLVTLNTILWIDRGGGATAADDALRGANSVTDEELSIPVDGRVRDVSISGKWLAWVSGRGDKGAVWAGSLDSPSGDKLAKAGAAVAADRERVVWAGAPGRRSTAILSWSRGDDRAKVLCRVPGAATSLVLGRRAAVWVTTDPAGDGDIWAYDFTHERASIVSGNSAPQASPVLVGDTVYWADRRSGSWELYRRTLQP
jgi:hypothetical protein